MYGCGGWHRPICLWASDSSVELQHAVNAITFVSPRRKAEQTDHGLISASEAVGIHAMFGLQALCIHELGTTRDTCRIRNYISAFSFVFLL